MADIKLFNINKTVKEYQSGTVTLEKELQTVIENNMNTFFISIIIITYILQYYDTTASCCGFLIIPTTNFAVVPIK